MAAPRSVAPTPNLAPFIATGAILLAVLATVMRLPGAIVLAAGLTAAAWMSTPPPLTGRKDAAGNLTVGNPGEQKQLDRHRYWVSLRWNLIFPSLDWLFNPPRDLTRTLQQAASHPVAKLVAADWWLPVAKLVIAAGWLLVPRTFATWGAVGLAAIAFTLPVDQLAAWGIAPETALWLMWPNAIYAYGLTQQLFATSRRFAAPADPKPAIGVDQLASALHAKGTPVFAAAVGIPAAGVVVGAICATVLHGFDITWLITPWPVTSAGVALVVAAVTATGLSLPHALVDWRNTVEARAAWESRWEQLKAEPKPHLERHQRFQVTEGTPPVTADTFNLPPGTDPSSMMLKGKYANGLTAAMGGGGRVIALNEPDVDGQGQPLPGTKNPSKVTLVFWPFDVKPDLTDPNLDAALFELLVRAACAYGAANGMGWPQVMMDRVELISEPAPTPTGDDDATPHQRGMAWAAHLLPTADSHLPSVIGPSAAGIAELLGVDVRPDTAAGRILFGDVRSDTTVFTDEGLPQHILNLDREDRWAQRWADVLKQGVQAPYIQHAVYSEEHLPTGEVLYRQPFMTPQGFNINSYLAPEYEKKLPNALDNAPFVSIQRWDTRGERPGERHPGAFQVIWSDQTIPTNPAKVVPAPGRGAIGPTMWVLSYGVHQGFDAAKLPRPEVVSAVNLTRRQSPVHIWDLTVRLYDGVTLAQVKQHVERIRQGMGATEWIRVTGSPEGCRIIAGATPTDRRVMFQRRQFQELCLALDWEQAFTDAKIVGPNGQAPELVSIEPMPKNPKVQQIIFRLPPGVSRAAVREAKTKLMPATGNMYLQDEAGPTPDTITLITCPEEPVPFPAPFDWDEVHASRGIPFAAGVTGEPVTFDWRMDPHLLVLGSSGSGKSASLQNLITGALIRGCDVYVADPTKAAADFQYAKPWVKAMPVTTLEASAMMDHVYKQEVVRRKNLNAQYGVASYTDLPEDVRPPHIVVVIDEFTSLMFTDQLGKLPPNATPEEAHAHREAELDNEARRNIGATAGRLVREARSAGITLILAAQELKSDTLARIPGGGSLKNNMSSLLLGRTTLGSRQSALKDPFAVPELGDDVPRGRGLFESSASRAQVIQSWFDAPDHVGSMTAQIASVRAPLTDGEKVDLSASIKTADDAPIFGRIIEETVADEFAEFDDEVIEIDLGDFELPLDDTSDQPAAPDTDPDTDALVGAPEPPPVEAPDAPVAAEPPAEPAPIAGGGVPLTATFIGPGVDDGVDWPAGAVDVDLLEEGGPVTGNRIIDTILAWVFAHPGVERIEWCSPAASERDADGAALIDTLRGTAELFGVVETVELVIPDDEAVDESPVAEPTPEPEEWLAEPVVEPELALPTVDFRATPEPEPEPEPVAAPEPDPAPEPAPAPDPTPEPAPNPASESTVPPAIPVPFVVDVAAPPDLDDFTSRRGPTDF